LVIRTNTEQILQVFNAGIVKGVRSNNLQHYEQEY